MVNANSAFKRVLVIGALGVFFFCLTGLALAGTPQPDPPNKNLQVDKLGPQPEPPDKYLKDKKIKVRPDAGVKAKKRGSTALGPQPEPPDKSAKQKKVKPRPDVTGKDPGSKALGPQPEPPDREINKSAATKAKSVK
jgi:hypothetical protein